MISESRGTGQNAQSFYIIKIMPERLDLLVVEAVVHGRSKEDHY